MHLLTPAGRAVRAWTVVVELLPARAGAPLLAGHAVVLRRDLA